MVTHARRSLVGAVALLGVTMQACTPDAVTPLSPEASGPAFAGTSEVTLTAEKTATPFWNQSSSYDWDIAKVLMSPNLVLQQGESGAFNFVITATRTEVASSSVFGMTGQVCVTNTSTAATENLRISDRFFEFVDGVAVEVASFEVDVSENPELEPGESHCYAYDLEMPADFEPNPAATYKNTAYVFSTGVLEDGTPTEVRITQDPVDVVWPSEPTPAGSVDATATVADVLDCPAGFTCTPSGANWTFGSTTEQPFSVQVTNVSATCGTEFQLVNSATLTEDDSEVVRGPATATGLIASQECAPPPSIHGCTPGYWKQKQHFDSWIGFTQGEDYDQIFGVDAFSPNRTLLQALSSGGGKMDRLGRHSVAALLNTSNAGVEYGMSTAQVINLVQEAVASGQYDWAANQLETLNERGCPLN